MLKTELLSDNKTMRFVFSEDLSVAVSAEIQQQLLKTNTDVSHLEITVQEVENIDLSFLQLLFSWARDMKQSGKNLTFDFQLGGEFEKIFEESGFKKALVQL